MRTIISLLLFTSVIITFVSISSISYQSLFKKETYLQKSSLFKKKNLTELGCCYKVMLGTYMSNKLISFTDTLPKDCNIEERVGGATRFYTGNCGKLLMAYSIEQVAYS